MSASGSVVPWIASWLSLSGCFPSSSLCLQVQGLRTAVVVVQGLGTGVGVRGSGAVVVVEGLGTVVVVQGSGTVIVVRGSGAGVVLQGSVTGVEVQGSGTGVGVQGPGTVLAMVRHSIIPAPSTSKSANRSNILIIIPNIFQLNSDTLYFLT